MSFTEDIKSEIVKRRKLERTWTKNKTPQTWQDFYIQRRQVANIIKNAQRNHYKQIISENKHDYKTIFNIANGILFRNQATALPSAETASVLADNFSDYFQAKVDNIIETLRDKAADLDDSYIEKEFQTNHRLNSFSPVLPDDVVEIVSSGPAKSCELDPIPTSLVKKHIGVLAPTICDIANSSFDTGTFSDDLKEALVRPLHKHPSLELELKNFRPVSNLPYLGKIIEKLACKQIVKYMVCTGQMEKCQSAYRQNCSTETALLKVKTDILEAIDKKEVTCLIMLDLSAAFDTVNHHLLLNRLRHRFGVCNKVLAWLESYLTNRTQKAVIQNGEGQKAQSAIKPLTQGIPQGSILGPILFNLFVAPLGEICRGMGVSFHGYADDTQNYLSFRPMPGSLNNQTECIEKLEKCIDAVRHWMQTNFLKLNENKTEFIILGLPKQLKKVGNINIRIGEDIISNVSAVKNLGIFLDAELKHSKHINKLTSSSFNILRNISRVRCHLDQETTKVLVQALILSKGGLL